MTITVMEPQICQRLAKIEVGELDAIRAALLSYSQPLRQPERRGSKLPEGMLLVIKAAAGDAATITTLVDALGHDSKAMQEASSFYLQQQLTGANSTPFRHLGLNDRASAEDIMLHKRWLLKWLHPDRNPNKWQTNMFNGVTDAAKAANALIMAPRYDDVPVAPLAMTASSHSLRSRSHGMRHHSTRTMTRKRVRIVNWREVLWRIVRRVALLVVFIPLFYLGASQLFGGGAKWAVSSADFWLR